MALMVPWEQQVDQPIPPRFGSKRIQPTRTFLGACVDEALERRENPWDPARLFQEWVVQTLKWVVQTLTAIQQEQAEARARSEASRRPLQPIEHRLVQILVDMPRGDLSLPEKVLEAAVKNKLRTEHKQFEFGRHALRHARDYVLFGELPRRRR
jgi:hypothetical protein